MALLTDAEKQQVADAIARVERHTDAELVTVLAPQADDYLYISILWAALIALIVPGVIHYITGWWGANQLLTIQWGLFIVLALLFRIPKLLMLLVPKSVRYWRACNLAKSQFLANNLHHTDGDTGILIFVSEAERYVEIIVDRGIAQHFPDDTWQAIIDTFVSRVRAGQTLEGFVQCIESCGLLLREKVPATHERNELPNHLIVLE